MLNLTNITLTYPDGDSRLTAIDDASLSIARGEFAAVTGASGSGKSSLLSVAATLVSPDEGMVEIDGVDATALDPAGRSDLRRSKLGIVFQAPNLIPSLTVSEQLEIMGKIGGKDHDTAFSRMSKAQRKEHILELLADVGMADFAGRKPGQLSGGQRQRVNIARAIVHHPAVLLVDEPTSALDQDRSVAIMELLAHVTRSRDLAALVVTHDQSQLKDFDPVFHMTDGVVTQQ